MARLEDIKMRKEILKMKLEKELAEKDRLCFEIKELASKVDLKTALNDSKLSPQEGDRIIKLFIEIYRHTGNSDTSTALLLGLWDDMEELVKLESLRKKLRFLDDEKLPEIYFGYTLLIAGETDPEVFGCSTSPVEILKGIQKEFPELTFRKAMQETVKEMIREKYKRQHMYEL
jgi:hypothetical protein